MALEIIISDVALKLETKLYKKPNGEIIIEIPFEFSHSDIDEISKLMKHVISEQQINDDELTEKLKDIVFKEKKQEIITKLPLHIVENLVKWATGEIMLFLKQESKEILSSLITK